MATANRPAPSAELPPVVLKRSFAVPRPLAFSAWSSAEHLKHWFCPNGYSVPAAEVEFRIGGAFNICMRSPRGEEHWTRGRYVEIVPDSLLVIEMEVSAGRTTESATAFRAHTTVSFADGAGGTELTVTQRYTPLLPAATAMIQGAAEGWSQTLDRLGQELERMSRATAPPRSGAGHTLESLATPTASRAVSHSTFRLERSYDSSPAQVYRAFTDPIAKAKWFTGGDGFTLLERTMDVRSGGRERLQGRWGRGTHGGSKDDNSPSASVVTTFDAIYLDVIPNERLIYTYEMHLDDRKISVSLATIELRASGQATRVLVTEQGAFLDGYEDAGSRERGTGQLLDALGRSLRQRASSLVGG